MKKLTMDSLRRILREVNNLFGRKKCSTEKWNLPTISSRTQRRWLENNKKPSALSVRDCALGIWDQIQEKGWEGVRSKVFNLINNEAHTPSDYAWTKDSFAAWFSDLNGIWIEGSFDKAKSVYCNHVSEVFRDLEIFFVRSKSKSVDLMKIFVERRVMRNVDKGIMQEAEKAHENPENRTGSDNSSSDDKGEMEIQASDALSRVLSTNPNVIITGGQGAGKTTLLRYLAITFARGEAQERLGLHERRVPVFVALRDFGSDYQKSKSSSSGKIPDQDTGSAEGCRRLFAQFLSKHTGANNLPDNFFEKILQTGECIVLLDGLDEITDQATREEVSGTVNTLIGENKGNRFILTSRKHALDWQVQRFLGWPVAVYEVREFDKVDQSRFVRSFYESVGGGDRGRAKAEALLSRIRGNPLANNPLLLSLMTLFHYYGRDIEQHRVKLFEGVIQMLLGYWDQIKGGAPALKLAEVDGLNEKEKMELLTSIAFWMHEHGEMVSRSQLEQEVARVDCPVRARKFIRNLIERACLLQERGRDSEFFAFIRPELQEYLAARSLSARANYVEYTLDHLTDSRWREVILMELGHLGNQEHDEFRARTSCLLERISERDLVLASRALAEIPQNGIIETLRKSLIEKLIVLWEENQDEKIQAEIVKVFRVIMQTPDGGRVREALLNCLEDADASRRVLAVKTMEQMAEAAAAPDMLTKLALLSKSENTKVVCTVLETLALFGSDAKQPDVLETLRGLRQSQSEMISFAATHALREIDV
jgi:hypothetical protein